MKGCLAVALIGLLSSCDRVKTIPPASDACNDGTILFALTCRGPTPEPMDVTELKLQLTAERTKSYDVRVTCDAPHRLEVAIEGYRAGDSIDLAVTDTTGSLLSSASLVLPERCLFWPVPLPLGEALDGGEDGGYKERVQGAVCSTNSQCASGQCVEGVCCQTSCNGICQSCLRRNTSMEDGICASVVDGQDPDEDCKASAPGECKEDGFCNGAGECRLWSSTTQCGEPSCNGQRATDAAKCNGTGTCVAPPVEECGDYGCSAGTCQISCAQDGDCRAGVSCINGLCGGKGPNGRACASAADCSSGHCIEGVCCGGACSGSCESCLRSKNGIRDGQCLAVASGTDPDSECQEQTQCGQTGTCDGNLRQCQVRAAGLPCAEAMCINGQAKPALACNGRGMCVDVPGIPCGNFTCGDKSCITMCNVNSHCAGTAFCDVVSGVCQPKKANGIAATSGSECQSSYVVDGVCCATASCPGAMCPASGASYFPAARCNAPGMMGTCSAPAMACGGPGACGTANACKAFALYDRSAYDDPNAVYGP